MMVLMEVDSPTDLDDGESDQRIILAVDIVEELQIGMI